MLKEQVSEILNPIFHKAYDGKYHDIAISASINLTRDKVLNLFKAEVDKLTVIDDEGLTEMAEMIFNFGIDIKGIKDLLWQQNKHQLQDIKRQLLDLMGE